MPFLRPNKKFILFIGFEHIYEYDFFSSQEYFHFPSANLFFFQMLIKNHLIKSNFEWSIAISKFINDFYVVVVAVFYVVYLSIESIPFQLNDDNYLANVDGLELQATEYEVAFVCHWINYEMRKSWWYAVKNKITYNTHSK